MSFDGRLLRRSFDGNSAGAPTQGASDVDWSQARGAFMVSGKLYTGWADGNLSVRDFDGTTAGQPTTLDLYGLPPSQFPVSQLSGMFFERGRLYYTVAGDPRLYFRYFTPESGVVGAEAFVASGPSAGFDWRDVAGLTLASGRLYFARSDGSLYRSDFEGGHPASKAVVVSGAGHGWGSHGLFIVAR
jgi:hypothetical protein